MAAVTTASWPTAIRLANVRNGQTWIMAGPQKSANASAGDGVNTAIHDPCVPCGEASDASLLRTDRPRCALPRFVTETTEPRHPASSMLNFLSNCGTI